MISLEFLLKTKCKNSFALPHVLTQIDMERTKYQQQCTTQSKADFYFPFRLLYDS